MSEYAYKNVIIDPTLEEAKNCIGKMVYYADSPSECLNCANNNDNDYCKILRKIEVDMTRPFVIGSHNWHYGCIILRKEEPKPKYIPFDNIEEFVNASLIHNKNHYLAGTGIWIEEVFKPSNESICLNMVSGCAYDNTICVEGYWLTLDKILDSYRFLDGTPCGKIKE